MKHSSLSVKKVTRGFAEDIARQRRYKEEGFHLETIFDKRKRAELRVGQLKQSYDLTDGDILLVKYISTPERGEKPTWEVYIKAEKGSLVLFP